ncbi:MAG: cofactor assembly of complex C subunit B [Spirulinaceae cyanobacterium]
MNNPILSSTFFLTLLLMVGLFFFIRASVKERIEQLQLVAEESAESLRPALQQYFSQRAYRVASSEPQDNLVIFQGFVKPSLFLAIFLTVLAVCALLCLAVVLSFLFPASGGLFLLLTILAPLSGIFYWRKAGRIEEVALKIEQDDSNNQQSLVTVTGHRDELAQLKQAWPLRIASLSK